MAPSPQKRGTQGTGKEKIRTPAAAMKDVVAALDEFTNTNSSPNSGIGTGNNTRIVGSNPPVRSTQNPLTGDVGPEKSGG
jgi:hypothetical protein